MNGHGNYSSSRFIIHLRFIIGNVSPSSRCDFLVHLMPGLILVFIRKEWSLNPLLVRKHVCSSESSPNSPSAEHPCCVSKDCCFRNDHFLDLSLLSYSNRFDINYVLKGYVMHTKRCKRTHYNCQELGETCPREQFNLYTSKTNS